jgi:hypothetical protein
MDPVGIDENEFSTLLTAQKGVANGVAGLDYAGDVSTLPGTVQAIYTAKDSPTYDGSGRVTTLAELSGNGSAATPTSGDSGYWYRSDDGSSRVVWDREKARPVLTQIASGFTVPGTFNKRDLFFYIKLRRNNSALHQVNDVVGTFMAFPSTSPDHMLWMDSDQMYIFGGTNPTSAYDQTCIATTPVVIAVRLHTAGVDFFYGDRIFRSATPLAAGTVSGAIVGRGTSQIYPLNKEVYEFGFVSGLTEAGAFKWVRAKQETRKDCVVGFFGNSTTAGQPWYTTNAIIAERFGDCFPNAHAISMAVNETTHVTTGSNNLDQQIANAKGLFNSDLVTGESYHPYKVRLAIVQSGTNDIDGGKTAAQIKTAAITRVSELRTAGATHVAWMQIPDSTSFDAGEDAVRATANASIAAFEYGHDIYISLDSRFDNATTNTSTVFEVESPVIHPSYRGSQIILQNIVQAVGSLLANGN